MALKKFRIQPVYISILLLLSTCINWPSLVRAEDAKAHGQVITPSGFKHGKEEALPVKFMNRLIFTIRSGISGYTQEERSLSINSRIKLAMEKGGADHISFRPTPEGGRFVELNGLAVFQVRPADLDPLIDESVDEAAKQAANNLQIAVQEAREMGNVEATLKGVGFTLLATVVFYLVCRVIARVEQGWVNRLEAWLQTREAKLAVVIHPQQATKVFIFLGHMVNWMLVAIAGYQWFTFSLSQFPYTRPWGEQLHGYLIKILQEMFFAIVDALPGLVVVFLIVMLTRFATELVKVFFARIESGEVTVSWISEDTAKPTRKLSQTLLWLFALAMAYPYLPGSDTEAFKGLSVLVGIMLSIGGSGVVGQAASGLIMLYSRVLREGEYVKVGGVEGVVTLVGIFSKKIRTSHGEEVNVPNSLIGSSTTVNSSRLTQGDGLVVNTAVTIGYNTPWRQVHAMLLRAAENTPGLRHAPKPFVSQAALSDFYVEYRLCAEIERPEIRRITLTALHANIQDIFNEFGVQIMSPHYENDPPGKVWVPKEQWHEAPAGEYSDGDVA